MKRIGTLRSVIITWQAMVDTPKPKEFTGAFSPNAVEVMCCWFRVNYYFFEINYS